MRTAMPYRNPVLQIIDVIWHKLKINTHPSDYYRFEFYKRNKSWQERRRYIGRLGSYYWPYESILLKDMSLLTNKYINKHLLMGMGLPMPELLATIGNDYAVRSCDDLKDCLKSWHFDIVIKPISSAKGSDVLVLRRENGRLLGGNGEIWPVDRLWTHLSAHLESGFLVERRVFNVGYTKKIYPDSLNTFRFVMIRTTDDKWHAPMYYMRFGCGKRWVDNINAGGIQVFLDDKGIATQAVANLYTQFITHHPDTGQSLVGFRADGFDEARALAFKVSNKFTMMGTVGWDIAYTADGPVIIEGNTLWSAGYQVVSGPVITEGIARGLKQWKAFSRFPRHRLFPGLQKKSRWPWRRTRWWA